MVKHSAWNPRRVVGVIAYAVLGISIVILFVSDYQQDKFDASRAADIAAARAETVHCIQSVLDTQLTGTDALRESSKARNDADFEVKRLAIAVGLPLSDPRVVAAWVAYRDAHAAYNEALSDNPVPDVEKVCG